MKLDAANAQTILRSAVDWRRRQHIGSARQSADQKRTEAELGNLLWIIRQLGVDVPTHEQIKPLLITREGGVIDLPQPAPCPS